MNKSDINTLSSCNESKNFEIDKEYEASASSMAEEIDEQVDNHHPYLHHYNRNNQHIPFFAKKERSGNSSTDNSVANTKKKDRHQKLMHQRENQPSPLHMASNESEEALTPNSGYEGDTEGPVIEDGGRI